jgi:transcriptional antiterminator NusG
LPLDTARWFALWTNSHCERLVHDSLTARGFRTFLPTIRDWSRRAGVRHLIPRPMFPGYLFVHETIDKRNYVEIIKTRGLVRILGDRWDSLAPVDGSEIESIRRFVTADVEVMPYPYLREGQRVRITDGPLADAEGYLVRSKPNRGLLVISIDLLQRSVAVEIQCSAVEPAREPAAARTSISPLAAACFEHSSQPQHWRPGSPAAPALRNSLPSRPPTAAPGHPSS